jgi:hypothetical protein
MHYIKDLDCVDGGECGHGLVNQCMRWIPRVRKQQIRCEMVDFFSSEAGDHYFRHLPAQKKAKGVTLKNETLRRLQRLECIDQPRLARPATSPDILEVLLVRVVGMYVQGVADEL